jgi:hypothetical protein
MWKKTIAILALLLLTGCATPDSVGGYFVARGNDFADMWRITLGPALGLHVRARAVIFQVGEGFSVGHDYGWDGRAGARVATWNRLSYSMWVPIAFNHDVDVRGYDPENLWEPYMRIRLGEPRPPAGKQPEDMLPAQIIEYRTSAILTGYRHRYYEREPRRWTRVADYYWIGAEATPAILTIRFGLNPVELLDWLGGIYCLDLLDDDGFGKPAMEKKKPESATQPETAQGDWGRPLASPLFSS